MTGIDRVEHAFERIRGERAALIPYLVAGFPSLRRTQELAWEVAEAGADLLEIGIPFTDPVADGPILAQASHEALKAGATPRRCLALVRALRAEGYEVPILGMTYANLVARDGDFGDLRQWRASGMDGAIVPDVPHPEAGALRSTLTDAGLAHCGFVSPTTPRAEIASIAEASTGFVYCVARLGTTGAATAFDGGLRQMIQAARRPSRPVCAGFGVSSPKQVRKMVDWGADGVIVGSALAERISAGEEIRSLLVGFRRATAKRWKG